MKLTSLFLILILVFSGCQEKVKYRSFICYRIDPASLICKYRARAENSNDEIIILDECYKYRVGQVIAKQIIE